MSVTEAIVKRCLRILFRKAIPEGTERPLKDLLAMTQTQQSRDERLAAKLRENLRRRKAQARARAFDAAAQDVQGAMAETDSPDVRIDAPAAEKVVVHGGEIESGALSKSSPES
jgi:ribosomal protein L2